MKTILIVDDEQYIRKIYKNILMASCRSVVRVLESGNALDAAEQVVREQVDVILLDIRMPRVSGRKLYDVIRKLNSNAKIIIISVFPIDQQRRLIPNADGYYDKSEGPFSLLEKVINPLTDEEIKHPRLS